MRPAFKGDRMTASTEDFNDLLRLWQEAQPAIGAGYYLLGKEFTLGLPGPCMPAASSDRNTGIGSPYGDGAQRVWDFFGRTIDKILLGPDGKTFAKCNHSPYCSETTPNPFFVPLEELVREKLIPESLLQKIYDEPAADDAIDFARVAKNYRLALKGLDETGVNQFLARCVRRCRHNYIGDIQVQIPDSVYRRNKGLFLKGFTLGSPPDSFSPQPQNWGFPVLNPELIFNAGGRLGPGGKILYEIMYQAAATHRGGIRIDHFIGFVNPFVISQEKDDGGRLYSSYNHPVLGRFAKRKLSEFADIAEKIILKAIRKRGLTVSDVYVEDLGARPEQLDSVLERTGLGHFLVSQFVVPDDNGHMYRLKNAKPHDIAAVDTHDMPSIQDFFAVLTDEQRAGHARQLAEDLRFDYQDDLVSDAQLTRMKWGELLASPARRVQGFFTSVIGQAGRYNIPGLPNTWSLRCDTHFDRLYFKNLAAGRAYNPFDAICLAIYARGDDFYACNEALVHKLRALESALLSRCAILL